MKLFPKETAAGRSYAELQKKVNEKTAEYRQTVADYKETLERYESDVHQVVEGLSGLKDQQEELQFLKEKQEYVLKNFPILEGNIVEKIKGAQAAGNQELLRRIQVLEQAQQTHEKGSRRMQVILWISLVFNLVSVGGIAVILLYLAEIIAF